MQMPQIRSLRVLNLERDLYRLIDVICESEAIKIKWIVIQLMSSSILDFGNLILSFILLNKLTGNKKNIMVVPYRLSFLNPITN